MITPSRVALLVRHMLVVPLIAGASLHGAEVISTTIGHTLTQSSKSGKPIRAWLSTHALSLTDAPADGWEQPHVAVLAPARLLKQLDTRSGEPMIQLLFGDSAPRVTLVALPDSWAQQTFPPVGDAYHGEAAVAHAVWRWAPLQAVDYLIEIRQSDRPGVYANGTNSLASSIWGAEKVGEEAESVSALIAAAGKESLAGLGAIPGATVAVASAKDLKGLLSGLDWSKTTSSKATLEARARLSRTPADVLRQLSKHYGNDPALHYIPALACIARMRFEQHQGGTSYHERIGAWIEGETWKAPRNGSEIAGRLLLDQWGNLATEQSSAAAKKIVDRELRRTADLIFDEQRRPRPAMPFHSEMSDAVFMAPPLLAVAAQRFDNDDYRQGCLRHVRFMQKLCLRDDGMYRHHPGNEAAWGRGNGFPALGLALVLSVSDDETLRALRTSLIEHLRALQRHQDADGAFHQIVDQQQAYRELTSTCMIAFAMQRCERHGWCRAGEFRDSIDRAWRAVRLRVGADGELIDVCTGTGKQRTFDDYYLRKAILGKDARGGAMAMTFAMEMLQSGR